MNSAATERPRAVPEVILGLAVFGLYSVVAHFDEKATGRADRAGRALFDLEKHLHIDVEAGLNRWLAPHSALATAADYEYASSYIVAAFGLLAWLYVRRPAEYRWARDSFIVVNLIGVACFALFPVTPPRLLPELGFVDTVRDGGTWGSWGSPMVEHANQHAAMPSLHIAWALWVSIVLARIASGWLVQAISAVHVAVTLLVIMATANHYLVDALGGALAAWVALELAPPISAPLVPSADAFFLHVESPAAPQHVGGLALLDTTSAEFTRDALLATIRAHLDELPRFRQQLTPPSRWRRARWVEAASLDWDWHVPAVDVTGAGGQPGGMAAVEALVAELAAERLPRDRPLWRFFAVTGVAPDRAAAVLIVHHVIADGVGTVAQAMTMLEPLNAASRAEPAARPKAPGAARRTAATVAGLAQLATDGRPSYRLTRGASARRGFSTLELPFDRARAIARASKTRVSDVLLSSVAGGLRRVVAEPPEHAALLRVAVPLMVREPGSAAEGNLTAAVMTDVPLGPMSEPARLAETARRSGVLYTGTRALASTFVMRDIGGALPPPLHSWFARTVYGGAFFQGIVSNMPGPQQRLSLAGAPLLEVYPILPLGPGAPLAVGALGWDGILSVGLAVDPALVPDASALATAIAETFAALDGGVARSASGNGRHAAGNGNGSAGVAEEVFGGPPAPAG